MSRQSRVVRDPDKPLWRVHAADETAGTARTLVRPDGRTFVFLSSVRADAYEPLITAISAEFADPLYANVDFDDVEALDQLRALGFEVGRRESKYVISVADARERLRGASWPEGYALVAADQVGEDDLRELDDALRQDVPGTDGWRWDVEGFREETYDAGAFDPALYGVAVEDATGDHVGVVRVWANRDAPRLGLIAVLAGHRRRGIARGLLAQVMEVLAERGASEVLTETDDMNQASRGLLLGLGARRVGGFAEMVATASAPTKVSRR